MNVYQKINELRKICDSFYKDTKNSGISYKYTSFSLIQEKIKDKMTELGIVFVPKDFKEPSWETYTYTTKTGERTDFITKATITYWVVNCDDPNDRLEINDIPCYGMQNDISKSFGSALTYVERYIYLKVLGIPTDDDDPDKVDTTEDKYKKPSTPSKTYDKQNQANKDYAREQKMKAEREEIARQFNELRQNYGKEFVDELFIKEFKGQPMTLDLIKKFSNRLMEEMRNRKENV